MTPSAEAGPGVSRPTARTGVLAVPVCSRMWSSACTSASTATSGPSCTQLGVSTSRSTRNRPEGSRTVALLLVPPLSRPTTTHEAGRPIVPSRSRDRLVALLDVGAVGVGVLEVFGSQGPQPGPGQEDGPPGPDDQAGPEGDFDPGGLG